VITAGYGSWRQMRYSTTLAGAIEIARRTNDVCRVSLHSGQEVSPPDAVYAEGASGDAQNFAKALRHTRYWAAPLDLLVVPGAVFLPEISVLFLPNFELCDELSYSMDHSRISTLWEKNGATRQVNSWYENQINKADIVPGIHALVHPRWHNIYTHWFTEALAALFDTGIDFARFDSICIPNGPDFQRQSLEMADQSSNRYTVLDQPVHRFEIAVVPTHGLARIWLHPAIGPGIQAFAARAQAQVVQSSGTPCCPIYLL
jgi:hypothetical protein